MTWRFGETNISRDHRFEDLTAEEASQVGSDLLRESGAVIVHCQQNALDGEGRVDRSAKAHERVEQFRYALEG
jgi:hypothetical protein